MASPGRRALHAPRPQQPETAGAGVQNRPYRALTRRQDLAPKGRVVGVDPQLPQAAVAEAHQQLGAAAADGGDGGASAGLAKERCPAVRASARAREPSTAAQTKPASSVAAPLQGPASRSSGRSRRCQAWGPRSVSTARSRRSPSAATAQTLPKGSSQTGVTSHPGGTRGAASKRASPRRTSAHQTSP